MMCCLTCWLKPSLASEVCRYRRLVNFRALPGVRACAGTVSQAIELTYVRERMYASASRMCGFDPARCGFTALAYRVCT